MSREAGGPGEEDRARLHAELPIPILSLVLGVVALIPAALTWLPATRGVVGWIAIPFCLLVFVGDAWMVLDAQRESRGGLTSLLLCAVACAAACAAVVVQRAHPWLG